MEDVAGLRVVFQRLVDAFNASDLDALVASAHEGIVQTGAFSPTAVDGKIAFKKVYQSFFSNYDNATFTPINPHFRVNDSTGISWGHFALSVKTRGAPMQIPVGCYTLTFTKTNREWLVVAAHFSWLPESA